MYHYFLSFRHKIQIRWGETISQNYFHVLCKNCGVFCDGHFTKPLKIDIHVYLSKVCSRPLSLFAYILLVLFDWTPSCFIFQWIFLTCLQDVELVVEWLHNSCKDILFLEHKSGIDLTVSSTLKKPSKNYTCFISFYFLTEDGLRIIRNVSK